MKLTYLDIHTTPTYTYNLQTTADTNKAPILAPLYVQSTDYIIHRWGFCTRISHCYTIYRIQYIQVRLPYPKVKTIILTMITVYTDEAPVPEYPLFCSLRTTVSTDEAVVPKHLLYIHHSTGYYRSRTFQSIQDVLLNKTWSKLH
jgi:hypothetical protein